MDYLHDGVAGQLYPESEVDRPRVLAGSVLPAARRLKSAIISSVQLWKFLLEVGAARRQASTYLALHRELDWENEFDDESRSIHQYLAGLTLTVHLTLIEFGLPEPSIRLILACYGPEDAGDFVLNERHQAQTELFSRRSHLPYVD